jgi:hypothetical protein
MMLMCAGRYFNADASDGFRKDNEMIEKLNAIALKQRVLILRRGKRSDGCEICGGWGAWMQEIGGGGGGGWCGL